MLTLSTRVGISVFLLMLFTHCESKNDFGNKDEHLKSLKNDLKFTFFDSVDMYRVEGVGAIDLSNLKYPFYALRIDSDFVWIHHYVSESQTEYRRFRKVKDHYISTIIVHDEEMKTFYHRQIVIYYSNREIVYSYFIYDDYELLDEISFRYRDGRASTYENQQQDYQHYNDTVTEDNIALLYPTLIRR